MPVAEVLPLPSPMRLIKAPKAPREEPRHEEMFQFPAVQETWEVSCAFDEDWDERARRTRKADRPAVAQGFGGSAVA